MQPVSGKQRPDLLTSLINMSLVLRLPRDMHLSGSSSHVPRLPSFLDMLQNLQVLLTFGKGAESIVPVTRSHASTSKSGANMWCFWHLTSQCASCHNAAVHLFDISTSISGPTLRCFVHVDFEVCFAPQRRAIFHLSSGQIAPHPSHKSLKKHCDSRLFYLFPHLHLLSSDSFSSPIFSLDCKPLPKPLLIYFGIITFPYHFPSTSHIFPCYVALFCQYVSHVQDSGGAPVFWGSNQPVVVVCFINQPVFSNTFFGLGDERR